MLGQDEDSQVIKITTGNIGPPAPRTVESATWQAVGQARREQGLSIEQVAARARVSPLVIEAIEAGAVERLPVGNGGRRETIAVCRVLGLDPRPFLQDLSVRRPSVTAQLDAPRQVGRRTRFLIIGLVWILLSAVLVVGRALGWMDGSEDTSSTTTSAPTTTVATTVPPNPAVAFTVEIQATRGGTPVKATVDTQVRYDQILEQGESVRLEGNVVELRVVQPTMVRVFVNGSPVAAEPEMYFGPPKEASEDEATEAEAP